MAKTDKPANVWGGIAWVVIEQGGRIADALELLALQGEIRTYKASSQAGPHPVAERAGARMLELVQRIVRSDSVSNRPKAKREDDFDRGKAFERDRIVKELRRHGWNHQADRISAPTEERATPSVPPDQSVCVVCMEMASDHVHDPNNEFGHTFERRVVFLEGDS